MATRCKTGWRVRLDRHTGKWEAYRNVFGPDYEQFDTPRRAWAYVHATTYGRHSEASTGKRSLAYFSLTRPRHRPGVNRWDASWLLYPTQRVLGFDGSGSGAIVTMDTVFSLDEKGPRWTLTTRGWTESMGISSAAAESFITPDRYWHRGSDRLRLCTLCRRPRDNGHDTLCPICLAGNLNIKLKIKRQ